MLAGLAVKVAEIVVNAPVTLTAVEPDDDEKPTAPE